MINLCKDTHFLVAPKLPYNAGSAVGVTRDYEQLRVETAFDANKWPS